MAQIQRGAKALQEHAIKCILSVCSAYCPVDPATSDMRAHTHPVHNLPSFHTSQCSSRLPSVRNARRKRRKPNKGPLKHCAAADDKGSQWLQSVQTPGKSTNNQMYKLNFFLLFLVYSEIYKSLQTQTSVLDKFQLSLTG